MSSERELALSVQGVSKAYTIAHEQEKPSTLAETLLRRVRHPFQRASRETFWALREVSFDVPKGEVVGIIGRNGAGKSTLLKLLSRITEPSTGQIDLYGRVGSLLEVGTGFHPELTGRENIFLNGAILGMTQAEIRRQFDAIVDFSGVEKFLDTPVKRYSSGMYVRLAFAVAAHLESEILIVDEVLAVGDAEFQKKCLSKMDGVSRSGRTVLFVSHQMSAVAALCQTVLLLRNGRVEFHGPTGSGLAEYTKTGHSSLRRLSNRGVTFTVTTDANGDTGNVAALDAPATFNGPLTVVVEFDGTTPFRKAAVVLEFYDHIGQRVTSLNSVEEGVDFRNVGGAERWQFMTGRLQLFPGLYDVHAFVVSEGLPTLCFEHPLRFEVQEANLPGATWSYKRQHGAARLSADVRVEVSATG